MSMKLSELAGLGGEQTPEDLIYVAHLASGPSGSASSTLNDFFSTITRNISDGVVRFQGFTARTVAGIGQGAIYFDATQNRFLVSQNGGVYGNLGDVVGPVSTTDNAIARFDGATGKLIQDSAVIVSDTSGNFVVPNGWFVLAPGQGSIQLSEQKILLSASASDINGESIRITVGTKTLSAIAHSFLISSRYSLSGGATSTDLVLQRFETSLGAGTNNFIAAVGGPVGTTPRFRITNLGQYLAGEPSVTSGQFVLCSSASPNTQAIQAADAPASPLIFKWPSANPVEGQVLTASAPVAGVVDLSWQTVV